MVRRTFLRTRRIQRRVGEIVFHSSLVSEIQAIAAMRTIAAQGEAPASVLDLRRHRNRPPPGELLVMSSVSRTPTCPRTRRRSIHSPHRFGNPRPCGRPAATVSEMTGAVKPTPIRALSGQR
jgi:hypothetical protein